MEVATAVLESHHFAATGAFSEEEARTATEAHNSLFAVVAGRFLDAPAQNRLQTAVAEKGAALITASIGHDDPKVHFPAMVIRKLVEERVRRAAHRRESPGSTRDHFFRPPSTATNVTRIGRRTMMVG